MFARFRGCGWSWDYWEIRLIFSNPFIFRNTRLRNNPFHCSGFYRQLSMIWNTNLPINLICMTNIVKMASSCMIQTKSIFLQKSNNIVISPVVYSSWHAYLTEVTPYVLIWNGDLIFFLELIIVKKKYMEITDDNDNNDVTVRTWNLKETNKRGRKSGKKYRG